MNKQAILKRAKSDPEFRRRVIAELKSAKTASRKQADQYVTMSILKKMIDWDSLKLASRQDPKFYDEVISPVVDSFRKALDRSGLAVAANMFDNALGSYVARKDSTGIDVVMYKIENLLK